MSDELLSNLQKLINRKRLEELYVPKLLIHKTIQTMEEYVADNLEPKSKHDKIKCNARIEAYEDCIKLLRELVDES